MLLFQYKFIENGQNFFSVSVHSPQGIAEILFVALRVQPFEEQGARDIYIASKVFRRMTAQKQTVKDCCFPLRGKRIEIIAAYHTALH